MQLRLSLPDGPRIRTVSLRAAPGTPWADVAAALSLPLTGGDLVVEYAGTTVPLSAHHLVGSPPLVHGATIRPGPGRPGPAVYAPVRIRVTAGPDVSGAYSLRAGGRLTLGRGPFCDVVVDDPGLSRHHLTISATRRGILVEDASSTNGSILGGMVLHGPSVWAPGTPLRAGATSIGLSPETASPARGRPDGAGRVVVPPRLRQPEPLEPVSLTTPDLTLPTAPTAPSALGWLLPLVVSVLLAVVLAMPALMLFGLMAPAMSLGGYIGERRRHRRECAAARASHRRAVADLRDAAAEALARETRVRGERVPDLAQLLDHTQTTGDLLWSRRAEPLVCRLGLGPLQTRVSVDGIPETAEHLPVEVDLGDGLVLVGDPATTRALARSVLLQLAVLHAPCEFGIALADTDRPQHPRGRTRPESPWDWLAWLPHVGDGTAAGPRVCLSVLDLTGGGHQGRIPDDPSIVLCRTSVEAPDAATVVAVVHDRLEVVRGPLRVTARPDLLSPHRAARAARILASLSDGRSATDTAGVPGHVDFASISPVPLDAAALADHWRSQPRTTAFTLGKGSAGDVRLDLATDGPHALVAGTTGSGKSELLRTMVTSLALGNRPDELVMVLVDYKGGSAFAEAAALPHVVGLITDLDPHLADRALTSLTAELKRRERILADAGAADLPAYQAGEAPDRLPRLVIVIDEFRALAEELPDFLDGLVRIAALGRSLGVHLVLATQRPGGVVSADVRANVNLRIALRVRDGSDSYDVIDSPAAADLPEGVPGRALIRTGSSPPRELQVASTSTAHTPGSAGAEQQLSIVPVPDLWAPDSHPVPPVPDADEAGQESTLVRAATAAARAADLIGAVAPASPWLPALPELVSLGQLRPDTTDPTTIKVPLMLTDLPAEQRQPGYLWRPLSDGHLGIAGSPRSGRSTVARSVMAGLLARSPADTHLYAFDLAGALGPLDAAPHVGAVLTMQDLARGARVIDHLVALVARRQQALAAAGFTSLEEQRRTADRPWPLVVLVIDGWPRFAELYGETQRGRPLEQVLQVLREGQSVGVVAVITGDRSLLAGRIAPLLPEAWSLRLTDSSDLLMAGLTRAQVPGSMPPGRAIRLRDGVVGQVAVLGTEAEGAAQVAALARRIRDLPTAGTDGPTAFRPLPRTVSRDEVATASANGLVLGVGGDGAAPVAVATPATASIFGVVGPQNSGRTSTLLTLAQSARSHLWRVVEVTTEHLRDASTLRSALEEAGAQGLLVTVDGLERFAQTAVEDALLDWLEEFVPGEDPGPRLLVVAGAPEDFGGFRGLGARVQRDRTGLVLQPTNPADGSALGVAVPTGDEPLPGRGVLVQRGSCTAVQVAQPASVVPTDERPV